MVGIYPMRKSDKNLPANVPESVSVPPITESGTPPATNATLPVAEVNAPPIGESETASPSTAVASIAEVSAPPIDDGNAPVAVAEAEAEAIPATTTAQTILPPPGKGSRSLDDYRKLDWTKSNADLARETGVSRQRISQIRKDIENKPAPGTPDFTDVRGTTETAVEQVVNYDIMAVSVFDMSTGMLTMIFGSEWQPKSQEEKQMVCMGLKNYFQSKQMQDLPPGLMLTAICLAYAAPRLREPSTSSKLKMGWLWVKTKLASFRKKKSAPLSIVN